MIPISYDGIRFDSLGIDVGIVPQQMSAARRPITLERAGMAPLHAGVAQSARVWTLECLTANTIEATMADLLAMLDFANPDERTMVCERNDGTLVSCQMAVLTWREIDSNDVEVDLSASDPIWRAQTPTVISLTGITGATAVPIVNTGKARTHPTHKIGWSANRSTEAATVGWKYRRQITITNGSDNNWVNELITLDLGDSAAIIAASKAQSDGDDVRIRYQGKEYARTLTNWGAERAWCHFLASIDSGESVTYDIVYGNPDATAPDDLSTRTAYGNTYAAPDLQGDWGTATGGSTTTCADTSKNWETDRWKGGFLGIVSGTGSVRWRRIASNTSTTITLNRALNTAPTAGSKYVIWMSGVYLDGGRVTTTGASSIVDNLHTRKWGTNQLKGATITFHGGTANPSTMTVSSNTTDTITFTSSFSVNPTVGDSYTITQYGIWSYLVDTAITETAHRGVYRINRYYERPGNVWPGALTPCGWGPETYIDNNDDFAVYAPWDSGLGGGHSANYWPNPRIRRRKSQDAEYRDEGNGDGVAMYTGQGTHGFYFDYRFQNVNGVGKFVVASREANASEWTDLVTDSTTRASITDNAAQHVDLTAVNYPARLFFGILPVGGEEIPSSAATSDVIEVRSLDSWEVWIDRRQHDSLASNLYTWGSEVAIYDLQVALRLSGGVDPDPAYDLIQVGGPNHWLHLISGQELWIRTDPNTNQPLAAVYDSVGTLVYRAAWAFTAARYLADIDGVVSGQQARAFMPIKPAINLLGTAQDRVTGWTLANGAGVSSTIANASTPDWDGNAQSIRWNFTATPAGAWTATIESALVPLTPGVMYEFGMIAYRSSMAGTIVATINAEWLSGLATSVQGNESVARTLTTNTAWYPCGSGDTAFVGSEVTDPTDGVFMSVTISGSGSMTGDVYLDLITLGPPVLYITEEEMGTLTLDVEWTEGWQA